MYEVEPAFGELSAVTRPDVWTVAMRNGIYVDACHACWMKWPDAHKLFPPTGFGRSLMEQHRILELVGSA